MKSRDILGLMAAYMAGVDLLVSDPTHVAQHSRPDRGTKTTPEKAAALKGLKAFEYPGGTVYALNQTNADRKARAKGYIQ